MLVAVLLTPHQIDDGQDADGIEDGDADKPNELVVTRALPHADGFPDAIPEGEENEHGDQQADPDGEVVCIHVHGLASLSRPTPASSANSLFSLAGQLEAWLAAAQRQVDVLTPSLLACLPGRCLLYRAVFDGRDHAVANVLVESRFSHFLSNFNAAPCFEHDPLEV